MLYLLLWSVFVCVSAVHPALPPHLYDSLEKRGVSAGAIYLIAERRRNRDGGRGERERLRNRKEKGKGKGAVVDRFSVGLFSPTSHVATVKGRAGA